MGEIFNEFLDQVVTSWAWVAAQDGHKAFLAGFIACFVVGRVLALFTYPLAKVSVAIGMFFLFYLIAAVGADFSSTWNGDLRPFEGATHTPNVDTLRGLD